MESKTQSDEMMENVKIFNQIVFRFREQPFFAPLFYACLLYWLKTPNHVIHRLGENDKVIRMRILPILSFTFRQITHSPHSLTFFITLQAFNAKKKYGTFKYWQKLSIEWVFFFLFSHSHSISWMTKLNRFDTELPIIIIIRII